MYSSIDTMWVLLGAILVFFMQAGFAMLEAGFTRAKNAGNIIMKNVMDLAIGAIVFFFIGFGIMYGEGNGFIGWIDLFVKKDYTGLVPDNIPILAFVIFQLMFCATAATIVSGAMAERTKFTSYCFYSIVVSMFIFPIAGHWIWGNGWLEQMGFVDFSGSTTIHLLGGTAALVGAKIVGPRLGKYSEQGKSKVIPGHNITIAALGIFILWFGWFGFNSCSTLSLEGDKVTLASHILLNTMLCASTAACTVMILTKIRYRKVDVSLTLNGCLAGLVAITAGCASVSNEGAIIIGICAGIVMIFAVEFIDKVLKIDDPVGAIGVHGGCGALGTIMVGLFSTEKGLLYTGNADLLLVQLLGVISVFAWTVVMASIAFIAIDKTIGIRVEREEEVNGLDSSEHGLTNAYADFLPYGLFGSFEHVKPMEDDGEQGTESVEEAIPVEYMDLTDVPGKRKITKVEILMKQEHFAPFKNAMNEIGVQGMTVTQVLGCGTQKGNREYIRGVEAQMQLLPKVQVQMVVSKVPVEKIIKVTRKVLYTGHIGDGKIFVSNIEDVVKIRTGERGYDALQGIDE